MVVALVGRLNLNQDVLLPFTLIFPAIILTSLFTAVRFRSLIGKGRAGKKSEKSDAVRTYVGNEIQNESSLMNVRSQFDGNVVTRFDLQVNQTALVLFCLWIPQNLLPYPLSFFFQLHFTATNMATTMSARRRAWTQFVGTVGASNLPPPSWLMLFRCLTPSSFQHMNKNQLCSCKLDHSNFCKSLSNLHHYVSHN